MKNVFVILLSLKLIVTPSSGIASANGIPDDPELIRQCQESTTSENDPLCTLILQKYEQQLLEEWLSFYPPDPLLAEEVDSNYGNSVFQYALVITDKTAIYGSLEDAVNRNEPSRYMYDGFNYVSYDEKAYVDGKVYYHIGGGQWIRGASLNSNIYPTEFAGMVIDYAPERRFGWLLNDTPSYTVPGYGNERTGITLPRYSLVEVYDTEVVHGWEWYLVEQGQWIEQRTVALVYPNSTPPYGIENGRWIEVNLFEQTLAVYEDNQMVFATLITSGSPDFYTRPGLFKIWLMLESTTMRGGDEGDTYYLEDVPWTMYFDESRGLHGEYWHDHLGYKSSHGCVNLSFADADWLYQWAEEGDWVYVWDPSGFTPVEPHLFTDLIGLDEEEKPRRFEPIPFE